MFTIILVFLREEFVLDGYRADRVIFDDGYMYYPYKKRGIVKVNNLGKIVKFYDLGNMRCITIWFWMMIS